jgi:long-chain acyl-CoA synthetase
MYAGARSVIVRELDPAALVRLIPAEGVTHGFLVPAVLQFMLMVPGVEQADFSSLETIVYGASPISDEVLARSVATFGARFWQAYGLTETTGAVVNLAPEDHDLEGPNRHRLRSCGVAGPGVELKIVDPESRAELPVGDVGEIWIRSPQVMRGYWNNDAATAEAVDPDGWFRSGDAGYLDEDGYLYIHDRVKDMIVSGGENIYPAEVENALMGHADIADAAVIGVPDDKWGEAVKACVVLKPGASCTADDIISFCKTRIASYKCPKTVDLIPALPRNPSGKVLRRELREPYWAGKERRVN